MNMEGAEIEVIAQPMQIPRFAIFFFHWKNIKLIVISDQFDKNIFVFRAKTPN